jgi:hypothetical protein
MFPGLRRCRSPLFAHMLKNTSASHSIARSGLVVLLAAIAAAASIASPVLTQPANTSDGWMLTVPKRRVADAPPAGPPPLPPAAESVRPTTIDIVVSRGTHTGRLAALHQTMSRTPDRIHLTDKGKNQREWLFERNPVDRRRVSATLIDHALKAIVLYDETDLRIALGIRGWADVLALGFDSELLSQYKRTGEVQAIAGICFARYSPVNKRNLLEDVWWSDEQALPSRFAIADSTSRARFRVNRIRAGVDHNLLRPAHGRFPAYRVYDLADWLERH